MVALILLVLGVLCFVLKGLGIEVGSLDLVAWGLALGFASFLPWGGPPPWSRQRQT